MSEKIEDDDLSYLDDIIGEMEESTKKSSKVSDEDRLNLCWLKDQKFTIRLVHDKNKKLYNECRLYKTGIKVKGDDGKLVDKQVKVIAKDWNDDPIRPLADELDDYKLRAKTQITFYGEITEIEEGEDDKFFKKGPCILVTSNKRFLNALKEQLKIINKKKKGLLAKILDPEEESYCFAVTSVGGQQGTVSITLDTFSDPHKFNEKAISQFTDITQEYVPKGGNEGEATTQLIVKRYQELLMERKGYADPNAKTQKEDVPDNSGVSEMSFKKEAQKEEAPKEVKKEEPKKAPEAEVPKEEPKESSPAISDDLSDLEKALAEAES
jgi:hypothetical protein